MGAGSSHEKAWREHWSELNRKAHGVQKKVMKQLKAEMKAKGVQPSPARIQEITAEENKKFVAVHTRLLNTLWDAYDVDKSHSLDKKECKVLFVESLKGQKAFLPAQIDNMFDATLTSGLELAELLGATRDELKEARKTLHFQSKHLKSKALKQLNEILDAIVKDADALTDQLFSRMDEDRDGKVSRDEFVRNFQTAHNELVNVQGLLASMQHSLAETA